MPKHRTLNLRKLVNAVSWTLFEEYFAQLDVDRRPSAWAYINPEAMFRFLEDPQNAEASGIILEDFKRINDICADGMNLVVRAYRVHGIPFNQDEPALSLAMRLFFHHREGFNYAWSRYLFHSSSSRVTLFRLDTPPLSVTQANAERFEEELTAWFRSLGKGEVCRVEYSEEDEEIVFLISHGSYLRTVAHWQGERLEIRSYRPASEDVVVYHKERGTLAIKASLEKDQNEYVGAFAEFIAGDVGLVERAHETKMFTLTPLQTGNFDFNGKGVVSDVKLVKARLKLAGPGSPAVEIKSEDVLKTLRQDLRGLSLADGELTLVRFNFRLEPGGERPLTVAFDIEPPMRTDLAQKNYADIIEDYLREQGVVLA